MKLLFAAAVILAIARTGQGQGGQGGQGPSQGPSINYLHCNLSGDPELHSFTNQMGTVPLPCFYTMTSLDLDLGLPGFSMFSLVVQASSGIEPYRGRYYISTFRVLISAFLTNGESSTASFTIDLNKMKDFWDNPGAANDVWIQNFPPTNFPSEMVLTNSNGNAVSMELSIADSSPVKITFIPVNRNLGTFQQSPTPGLFLTVDGAVVTDNDDPEFPNSMCSTPSDDRTFREIKEEFPYNNMFENNRQLLLYTALQHGVDQDEPQCRDLLYRFNQCEDKMLAVRACANITEVGPVKCLEETALNAFDQCIISQCMDPPELADAARILLEDTLSGCHE